MKLKTIIIITIALLIAPALLSIIGAIVTVFIPELAVMIFTAPAFYIVMAAILFYRYKKRYETD